jgi:splicing factor 3B subunit 3
VPLVAGGKDVLVYTTISGSIGALIPFQTKDDIEFMSTLEMVNRAWKIQLTRRGADCDGASLPYQHMRTLGVSLTGRDHLSYRSYYVPVKSVVDGDLCEAFSALPYNKQQQVAGDLDRTVGEVLKKVESFRTSSAF